MLTVAAAQAKVMYSVLGAKARLGVEPVVLAAARGRYLAQDVFAPMDVPPWANSAMDGYAVRSAEAYQGASLPVSGVVYAGQAFEGTMLPGTVIRIMTGAPVPDGADTVVMQENTVLSLIHI